MSTHTFTVAVPQEQTMEGFVLGFEQDKRFRYVRASPKALVVTYKVKTIGMTILLTVLFFPLAIIYVLMRDRRFVVRTEAVAEGVTRIDLEDLPDDAVQGVNVIMKPWPLAEPAAQTASASE